MSDYPQAAAQYPELESEQVEAAAPLWAAVISLGLSVFTLVTAEFLPSSLLTPIAADLGISNGTAGQTVTVTAVVAGIAALTLPLLTQRFDRRLVMWSLIALSILSSLLAATATGLASLLVARLLLGVSLGGFWAMSGAMAMRLVPPRLLPRAMSIVMTGVSVATVCAAPVGAYIGSHFGWRAAFAISAVLGGVVLIAQMVTLPRLPPTATVSAGSTLALLRRPSLRNALIVILLVITGHFAGFTYIRPFLEQVPAFNVEGVTLILLAYGIGGFLGNYAGAFAVERSLKAAIGMASLLIALMMLLLFIGGTSATIAAVGVAVWGFAFGALPVGFQTWLLRSAPDQAESAGGLMVATFQTAIASGAIIGGIAVDTFGTLGAVGFCTMAALAASVFVLMTRGELVPSPSS